MKRDYDDPLYKRFRIKVLKRDKFCCQWPKCGSTEWLHVHHIRPWAKFPTLRYNVDNGISLCKKHHDNLSTKEALFQKLLLSLVQKINNNTYGNSPRHKSQTKSTYRRTRKDIARAKARKRYKKGYRASRKLD